MKRIQLAHAVIEDSARPDKSRFQSALEHHQAGRFPEAAGGYQAILATDPENPEALHMLGVLAHQLGQPASAMTLLERALLHDPRNVELVCNLGNAQLACGEVHAAIVTYRKALGLDAQLPGVHYNLGNALCQLNSLDEAIGAYQNAVAIHPQFVAAHFNLGNTYLMRGELEEALASYRKADAIQPNFPSLQNNIGNVLHQLDRLEEAEVAFRKAVEHNPRDSQSFNNLGCILGTLRNHEESFKFLKKSVELDPDVPSNLANLARAAYMSGHLYEGVKAGERALQFEPDNFLALASLGVIYGGLARFEDSYQAFKKALVLEPLDLQILRGFATHAALVGETYQAIEVYQQIIEIEGPSAEILSSIGFCYKDAGELDLAIEYTAKALEIDPHHESSSSNYLMLHTYSPKATNEFILEKSVEWAKNMVVDGPRINAKPTAKKKIRIGYLSADFHAHPAGYLYEALFPHHDRSKFEIVLFANMQAGDDWTVRIMKAADKFYFVKARTDAELAELVQEEEIDIFVDLLGHTANHRLGAFAMRPAPVQASWLGYFATTGMSEMDYILADQWIVPSGEESSYSEDVARMPNCLYVYQPPTFNIKPNPLPAKKNGYVTFGCFNNTCKIHEDVVALWAEVLKAVPGSKLILNRVPYRSEKVRETFVKMFEDHGIEASRLEFQATLGREAYFQSYHQVDIMLDTFPFGGGTTTSDATWMGVPVMTLPWDRFAGHMTESIYHTVGVPELLPVSREEFVALTVGLANDLDRLSSLRENLRTQMTSSRLCDIKSFAKDLEQTFEWMWTEKTGLPLPKAA